MSMDFTTEILDLLNRTSNLEGVALANGAIETPLGLAPDSDTSTFKNLKAFLLVEQDPTEAHDADKMRVRRGNLYLDLSTVAETAVDAGAITAHDNYFYFITFTADTYLWVDLDLSTPATPAWTFKATTGAPSPAADHYAIPVYTVGWDSGGSGVDITDIAQHYRGGDIWVGGGTSVSSAALDLLSTDLRNVATSGLVQIFEWDTQLPSPISDGHDFPARSTGADSTLEYVLWMSMKADVLANIPYDNISIDFDGSDQLQIKNYEDNHASADAISAADRVMLWQSGPANVLYADATNMAGWLQTALEASMVHGNLQGLDADDHDGPTYPYMLLGNQANPAAAWARNSIGGENNYIGHDLIVETGLKIFDSNNLWALTALHVNVSGDINQTSGTTFDINGGTTVGIYSNATWITLDRASVGGLGGANSIVLECPQDLFLNPNNDLYINSTPGVTAAGHSKGILTSDDDLNDHIIDIVEMYV